MRWKYGGSLPYREAGTHETGQTCPSSDVSIGFISCLGVAVLSTVYSDRNSKRGHQASVAV